MAALALPPPVGGQFLPIPIPRGGSVTIEGGEAFIARELAKAVAAVRKRFERSRRDLPTRKDPSGERSYFRGDVTNLVDRTAVDLDRAIEETGEPGLNALRDWAAVEIESIRGELGAAESPLGARFRVSSSPPTPIAVLASLAPTDRLRLLRETKATAFADTSTPSPPADRVARKRADGALDRLEEVVKAIFVLARKEDLQVTVKLKLDPASAGDLVLFPKKHLCDEDERQPLVRGDNPRVWRGLYRFEQQRATPPFDPCAKGFGDWPSNWSLDFVNLSRKVRCDFSRPRNQNPCQQGEKR